MTALRSATWSESREAGTDARTIVSTFTVSIEPTAADDIPTVDEQLVSPDAHSGVEGGPLPR